MGSLGQVAANLAFGRRMCCPTWTHIIWWVGVECHLLGHTVVEATGLAAQSSWRACVSFRGIEVTWEAQCNVVFVFVVHW